MYITPSVKKITEYVLEVPILLILLALELSSNFNNEYIHPRVSSMLCGSYVTTGESF